jgi:hypothetical protein
VLGKLGIAVPADFCQPRVAIGSRSARRPSRLKDFIERAAPHYAWDALIAVEGQHVKMHLWLDRVLVIANFQAAAIRNQASSESL